MFRLLDPGVVLNLRDTISLQRFDDFARKRAHLVADAAFMLTTAGGHGRGEAQIAATIARPTRARSPGLRLQHPSDVVQEAGAGQASRK